ncbi:Hypothetical protein ZAZAV_439 [Cedratvirus Zaza IHUMI]|uniref:Uncharacterized protein n=1 Tax=Cedratvirus Zaza IHUMI TaxID=2126979 RepID=A0A2R8FFE7_9VIRU|nr:Hypothetical protein ZAZAV_439 [Cedratvirus Zaza IHUMI]
MPVSDYVRLVTAVRRYISILQSAHLHYHKKTKKDPSLPITSNRSSLTTIFHLLNIPPPLKHSIEINLCDYEPIAPSCYPVKTNSPKSILKSPSVKSPSRVKRNVKFVGV